MCEHTQDKRRTSVTEDASFRIESRKISDYDPFENRSIENPNSTLGAMMHMLKGGFGIGILAMPNAFKHSGIVLGTIGTIFAGLICTYNMHMLVSVSHQICRKARIPVLGFTETAEAVFLYGPQSIRKFASIAVYAVDACIILLILANAAYIVFICENLKQLFDYWFPEYTLLKSTYILLLLVPLVLIGQIRSLKHLVPLSLLSNVCVFVTFGITLYYMLSDIPDVKQRSLVKHWSSLPLFFSTVVFTLEVIPVVMPVENSMSRPQDFLGCPGVLTTATTVQVVLNTLVGIFGYIKYGEATEASITLNLPTNEIPAQLVKFLIVISALSSYFLIMNIIIDMITRRMMLPRVKSATKSSAIQVAVRIFFVFITIGIATAVPNLEPIIGLTGSISLSTLGLLIPAILETIVLWDGELGTFNWKLIKNFFLGAFSLFALVSGSAQSLGYLTE